MPSTPYKQAYVATMENGAVLLVVVSAFHRRDGEEAAKEQAAAIEQCAVWAICAYPTFPELPEGSRRLFSA